MSESAVRKRLNSLTNLYKRAVSEGYVQRSPVAEMYSKPTEERREADFLEAEEAALFLEAARTYQLPEDIGAYPWIHPLLAMFLLHEGGPVGR